MKTLVMMIVAAVATAQARDLDAARGQILNHAAQVQALSQEMELLRLQNEIAKLRKECLLHGYTCAAGGLRETTTARRDAPDPGSSFEAASEAEFELVGVAGGRARIAHPGGETDEYREGDAVAGWRLETIELDRVHLSRGGVRRTLHLVREAGRIVPGAAGVRGRPKS